MIVGMKKAKLIFLADDQEKILKKLQLSALMMLDSKHLSPVNNSADMLKTQKAINFLGGFLKKSSFGSNEIISKDKFSVVNPDILKTIEDIIIKIEKYTTLKNEIQQLGDEIHQLTPFKDFPFPLERVLKESVYLKNIFLKIALDKKESFLGQIQSLDLYYEVASIDQNLAYIIISSVIEDEDKLFELIQQNQAQLVTFPPLSAKNQEAITNYQAEVLKRSDEIADLTSEFKLQAENMKEFKLLYDQLTAQEERHQITFLSTQSTVYLEGWVRKDQTEILKKLFDEDGLVYEIELRDPLEEEIVPTALKNNKFVQSFENITNEFSVPSYRELDPNPSMSFWYWLIFGIMMGDIGYGLVMLILFGTLLKFGKLRGGMKSLVQVFMLTGITALLAGATFGSFFGFSLYPPLLDPINDPLPMLIISLGIGIVHIIHALILKLILSFKRKDFLGGIADAGSWISILFGLTVFAVNMAYPLTPILDYIAYSLIGLGVLIILTLSGRHQKKIFSKIMSGLGGLYNSTAYLSDILSYSRILALALSSGVIAMTFNILGGMVLNSIPVLGIVLGLIIYLIGHVFNFIMGLLSAYVHAGRLQYLEFYGKFFEGGGYLFEPLSLKLKYVYEIKD